jgi:4-amino-4-deoxy-L-arabinose transferase-like glycosyltransferase
MRVMRAEAMQQAPGRRWAATFRQRLWAGRLSLAFGVVVLAAAGLRWWGLGAKSLWFDEAYSVFVAQQPLLEIPRLLRAYDTHPPLYYIVLHLWTTLFGKSEVAVRFPSVIASVGVVALTFLLARRVAGDRVGILAAILIAFSPFQITAAQEARMYPFLTLFGLGGSYALWLALEEGKRRYWTAYAVLTLLALYTHYFAFLLVLTHVLYILLVDRSRARIRTWMLCLGLMAVAYLPLLPTLILHVTTAIARPNFRPDVSIGALTDLMGLLSFGGGLFGMGTYFQRGVLPLEFRAAILLPFVLLIAAGAAGLGGRRRAYMLGYWLLPVVIIAAVSLRWSMFYERYFSFVLPPFAILLAAGVFSAADALRGSGRVLATVSLLAMLASFNLPALAHVGRVGSGYNWRGAAGYVAREARSNDFILFIPAFARIPFEYYFQGDQRRTSLNPAQVRTGKQLDITASVDVEAMATVARRHPRMWLVATSPVGTDMRLQMARVLAPYFREVEGKDFGLVYIFLWESRPYGSVNER